MSDDLVVGRINFLTNEPLQVSIGGIPFNRAHLDARAAEIKRLETALTEARAEIERLREWKQNQLVHWPMEIERRNRELAAAESELSTLRARVREVVGTISGGLMSIADLRAFRQLIEEVK